MTIKPYSIFLLFTVLLHSCAKDAAVNQQTSLEVNLEGIEIATNEENNSRAATPLAGATPQDIQLTTIPFDQDFGITVSLTPEIPSSVSPSENAGNTTARAAGVTQSGPQSWKLNEGIKYRLLAYNASQDKVVDTVYTVGNNTGKGHFLNSGEAYTFVLYSILSDTEVPAAPSGKLNDATFTTISGDKDFIYFSETRTLSPGRNELIVMMKHLFSQLTTRINSSQVGTIGVVKARVGDHHLSPTIKLSDGSIPNYGSKATEGKTISFVKSTSTNASHEPTIVCNDGSKNSVLTFDEITINNITKRNLAIPNIQLAPGTRYVLTLTIKTFTADEEPGIDLGGVTYGSGNLIYDRITEKYGFATTGNGDYWFKNYLLPRRTDLDSQGWGVNNQRPRSELNGGPGDPCTKVLPLNSWRLPTKSEVQNIGNATAAKMTGHPGPDINQPVRYYENNYKDTGKIGMYFGTQTRPANNANNYLFMAYDGYYPDNQHLGGRGSGWYMVKTGNTFDYLQMGNTNTYNIMSLPQEYAVSIRCVKAN